MVILVPISRIFFCKNGQKGQKATPEVADGNHGGLGRGQEGKNGLEGGQTSKNADPLLLSLIHI